MNEKLWTKSKALVSESIKSIEQAKIIDSSGWFDSYIHKDSKRVSYDLFLILSYFNGRQIKICDYGGAPFVLSKALDINGSEVVATDIAVSRFSNLENLNLNIVNHNCDSEKAPFPDESFDVVVLNEVFEHLRGNLIFTIKEIHRILKPGGVLFLSTPNLRSIKGILNILFKGIGYVLANDLFHEWNKIGELGHMGHVREYTPQEVKKFLEKSGFKTISVIYRGKSKSPGGLKGKIINFMESLICSFRPNFSVIVKK